MSTAQSSPTRILDVLRHVVILSATAYVVANIWAWHWLAAVVACVPVYVVMLNLVGFITLPLYAFTPEVRNARRLDKQLLAHPVKPGARQ